MSAAHQAAELFFARLVAMAREYGWNSEAHFSIDGTLIDARARLKSFQPKDGQKYRSYGDSGNRTVDFHGDKRGNSTHRSTTDSGAQLASKGNGREARLNSGLHALIENRNGLSVPALVSTAHGKMESKAATALMARQINLTEKAPETLAAAMALLKCAGRCLLPRELDQAASGNCEGRQVEGLVGRTSRSHGYQTSRRIRKRIEEVFG